MFNFACTTAQWMPNKAPAIDQSPFIPIFVTNSSDFNAIEVIREDGSVVL
jgi:hypothetical protein